MRFGTQDKDFFPKEMTEKFRFAKEMGFTCFEADGSWLLHQPEEVKKAVKESGLPVSTACGGYRGWIGDFIEERRLNGVADLKVILERLAEIGGTGVVVPAAWGMFTYRLPPMQSPRSREGDEKALLASLAELDPAAEESGTWIYLEPLNRYQDHMLNTMEDAVSLVKKGGFRRVKTTYDFYHMAIEEDDMKATLRKYRQEIGHIHIAENHRYQPGTGAMDWEGLLQTIRDIRYEGDMVFEGRIRGEDPLAAYQRSVDFMKNYL